DQFADIAGEAGGRKMKHRIGMLLLAAAIAGIAPAPVALAQDAAQVQAMDNQIEGMGVAEQGGALYVRLTMGEPMRAPPPRFSLANPARIAFDFPATGNALGRTSQTIEQGDLRSANIVQAGDRTRVVLKLVKMNPHEVSVDGRSVVIAIRPTSVQAMQGSVVAQAQG